jgi:uncharacterized protein (TIGR02996 family)
MTDRDAFLAAIRAEPDEDTPRLAFADWLDEQGTKPDQFQADFIRTACRLARGEPWSSDWIVLNEHHAKLARRIPEAWTAHLKGRVIASDFERGFVGHVTMYSKRFVAEAEKLFDRDPIRTLKFATLRSTRGSVPAAELFRCPHLARASGLVLEGSGLKDKELTALAASPHTANLRMLSLGGDNPFARTSLPKLLAARPGITELVLVSNAGVKDAHAKALAGDKTLANLTSLDLARTGVTAAGIAALVASKFAGNLRALSLAPEYEFDEEHGHFSGPGGSRADGLAVAQAFAASSALARLEVLDLTQRKLGNNGLAELAQARGLPKLRRLLLAENGITKKGVEALANTPLGQQLRYLDLMGNGPLVPHEVAVKELFPKAHVRVSYEFL